MTKYDENASGEQGILDAQRERASKFIAAQLRMAGVENAYSREAMPVYLREMYFKASRTAFLASVADERLKRLQAVLSGMLGIIALFLAGILVKLVFS